jgi:hypothetical protein
MLVTDEFLAARVAHAQTGSFYGRHLAGRTSGTRVEFQNLPTSSLDDLGPGGLAELSCPGVDAEETAKASAFLSSFVTELNPKELLQATCAGAAGSPSPAALVATGLAPAGEIRFWRSERVARAMQDLVSFAPGVVWGDPRALLLLAEESATAGVCKIPPSISLVLASGLLPTSLRSQLEEDWGARVVELYQRPEAVLLGASCPEGSLHLANDLYSCEILDPVHEEPVPPGARGVLVITSLQPTSTPLVRWRTGDLVEVGTAACKCERPDFPVRRLGSVADTVTFGGHETTAVEILAAAQTFAAALDSRIFYTGVRAQDLRILVEVSDPQAALPTKEYLDLRRQIGLPIDVRLVERGSTPGRLCLDEISDTPEGQLWRIADWTLRAANSSPPKAGTTGSFFSADRWREYRQERQRNSRRRALLRVMESQEPT